MLLLFTVLIPFLFDIALFVLPFLALYQFFHTGDIQFLYLFFVVVAWYALIYFVGKSESLQALLVIGVLLFWVNEKYNIYRPWVQQSERPTAPLPNQKYISYINDKQQQVLMPLKRDARYQNQVILDYDRRYPEQLLQQLVPLCQPLSDVVLDKFRRREMVNINVPVQCSDFIANRLDKKVASGELPVEYEQRGNPLQEDTEQIVVIKWYRK